MSSDCKKGCSTDKPIREEAVIKERKPEPTGDDEVEPRSCGNCIHQKSCGAYWMTKKMGTELHKEFGGFVRFPFPIVMLALKCDEFVDRRKVTMPSKKKKKK